MSRTTSPKGTSFRTTIDTRPGRAGETLAPTAGPLARHAWRTAVERARIEAFVLSADDEARRLGKERMSERDRRNAERRKDRARDKAVASPEGRAALTDALAMVADGRPAARMFARTNAPTYRAAIVEGFTNASRTIDELGLSSHAARADEVVAALLKAVGLVLVTDALEAGPRIMALSKTTEADGVTAHASIAGFDRLVANGERFLKLSQVYSEQAIRKETRFREEEKQRRLADQARAWRKAAEEKAIHERALLPTTAAAVVDDAPGEVATDPVGSVECNVQLSSGDDDRQVVVEQPNDLDAVLREQAWCAVRQRTVPASIANTPRPSAASGPDWVERLRLEEAELAAFDEALKRARASAARRRN